MASLDGLPDLSKLSISEEKGDKLSHSLQNGPLPEEFYQVQCPFTWFKQITPDKIDEAIMEYQNSVIGEPRDWRLLCTNLLMAYCHARLGKMDKAFGFLENCREELHSKADDDFYKDIFDGLDHAIKATMAHIYFLKGDAEKADDVMSKVIPVKELKGPCEAVLIAIHATQSHDYNLQPIEANLPIWEEVIKLDPDEKGSRRGIWYFMLGKLQGQVRRINFRVQMPPKEELQLLERATKHNPFPVYLATLAESYREAARCAYNERGLAVDERTVDRLNAESQRLLIAASKMDGIHASTLRRCGNGLLKLPRKYQQMSLARECLKKAISLDPYNAPAYQALGNLEERSQNNNDAAKYFQLAIDNGNILSGLALIRVRFKMDRQYNPIKDCDAFIEKAENQRILVKAAFIVAKGEYYLSVKNDLIMAAKEWKKAIDLVPDSDAIKCHWKLFQVRNSSKMVRGTKENSINVYECLKSEIKRAPRVSAADQAFLDQILEVCQKNV